MDGILDRVVNFSQVRDSAGEKAMLQFRGKGGRQEMRRLDGKIPSSESAASALLPASLIMHTQTTLLVSSIMTMRMYLIQPLFIPPDAIESS